MTAPLLTATELAEHLNIQPGTVQLWARQDRIPFVRVGRLLRFDLDAVRAELARHDPWAAPQRGRRAS